MKRLMALVSLFVIVSVGCMTAPATSPVQPVTPPVVVAFCVSSAQREAGDSATLLWNVTGAASVSIDQGVGNVAAAGTKAVSPAETTVYTLTATNAAGSVTNHVSLTVEMEAPLSEPPVTTPPPVQGYPSSPYAGAGGAEPGGSYPYGYGPGGMMGSGGMMGYGGMMGPGGPYTSGGERITMDQAVEIVNKYLRDRNDPNLKAAEILEFSYNFYVGFSEKDTGIHAFEVLIDPYTGDMYPEPGPNMMWNTKYGMMSGMMWGTPNPSAHMTVTEEQAKQYAQEFIDGYLPGAEVEDADRFYGYYTVEITKNNQIYGMLSINGYTGQVWYHSWHGLFLDMRA